MTIKEGDWVIAIGDYGPKLMQAQKVTEKTVTAVAEGYGKSRLLMHQVGAYGPDKEKLSVAIARMSSASSERHRRESAARIHERTEHARILKGAMS